MREIYLYIWLYIAVGYCLSFGIYKFLNYERPSETLKNDRDILNFFVTVSLLWPLIIVIMIVLFIYTIISSRFKQDNKNDTEE